MLKLLQVELPKLWTDELYSAEFKAHPAKHRDFQHALIHVMKAVGQLSTMVELSDHHEASQHTFPNYEVEKYLADLVICTVRLALTAPGGAVDIEQAVLDRIERKMKTKLIQKDSVLLETLEWLDRIGGLGLHVHERIRAAIDLARKR